MNNFYIIESVDVNNLYYICDNNYYSLNDVKYHESWSKIFNDKRIINELNNVFNQLNKLDKNRILPTKNNIFNAFVFTEYPPKVIILGQDPYKNSNEAIGLSFSVDKNCKIPPSLANIYKELKNDISDFVIPNHGHLLKWAEQGVLLLNTALTLYEGISNSHQSIWNNFINILLNIITEYNSNIVFLLWGNNAKDKKKYINMCKSLESSHPSPLSVNRGFFGCKHFSKCNELLKSYGITEINWLTF